MPEKRRGTVLPTTREEVTGPGTGDGHFIVVVYDNDRNTFDQVITVLMQATGCSLREAEMETWEVHHLGRSVVHHGSRDDCEQAAMVIATIGIRVEVLEE
jgi:ATP-dependent Clp protease adapter protein ClpS